MPKTESKVRLRCWSYSPMLILCALSSFIYMSYLMIYVTKLLTNSYEFSIVQPQDRENIGPGVLSTMQKMTDYSNHVVGWIDFSHGSLSSMQKKGLIYLCVSHFAFLLFIISAIRTSKTSPGHVPESWHSTTEETIKTVIETEKRVLMNMHKAIRKKRQELFLQKTQPIIIEASISQESDFLVSPDHNTTREGENSLLISPDKMEDAHETIHITEKTSSDGSQNGSTATDDEDRSDDGSKQKLLKDQIEKLELKEGLYSSEKINKLAVVNALKRSKKRYCAHCQKFKPERTHHCSQCGVCVLRMDHHCPWINNCIGFYNYKYFFAMIFWANVSLLFIVITYAEAVIDSLFNDKMPWLVAYLTILSYILTVVLSVVLGFFICFHIWLACRGKTTLEFCENKLRKGYDKGVLENLRRVLGRYYFTWLLPCAPNLEGEGLVF